jgi:hypothetical protein
LAAAPLELGRHRDRVGRLAAPVEVEHALVDRLVGRPVEVVGPQQLDDVGDRVLAEQDRAQHRLLGRQVLGRLAIELRCLPRTLAVGPAAGAPRSGRPPIVQNRHESSSCSPPDRRRNPGRRLEHLF